MIQSLVSAVLKKYLGVLPPRNKGAEWQAPSGGIGRTVPEPGWKRILVYFEGHRTVLLALSSSNSVLYQIWGAMEGIAPLLQRRTVPDFDPSPYKSHRR